MARPGKLKTLIQLFDFRYFNGWNSLRSSVGFTRSLFMPGSSADSLEQIFNFLPLSSTLASSGQPSEEQFKRIAKAGFRTVVNLAPHGAENALEDEALVLKELGLHYIHIPVDFKQPTDWDYKRFCHAMKEVGDNPVWVHCAANMRVSAFCIAIASRSWAKTKQLPAATWKRSGRHSAYGRILSRGRRLRGTGAIRLWPASGASQAREAFRVTRRE
ncbi:hypothetical protein Y5S_03614 [Alcanivorax nanhaiticus]|uniref:DSP-PTPase phosphatase fused to NAD+ Kinase domain-containing protein n=1 Tax=Alcanivorax nanhaiticus TaxID=1177154 RepID=A0A095SEG1_9GAMM|nr:protein tyrosine phosphatase family protein [Alcanivorax nanhaiticus]KGD62659.1 hypothetical protein Y5S_03614 [Alcanivorax nanhaiticus]